jgi:hypothetical protein
VGEQSNAYRILLRYDRKSRHRRIKKQRRYERLAATSQFLTTETRRRQPAAGPLHAPSSSFPGVCESSVTRGTLSGGSSPYLKPRETGRFRGACPHMTHTLASVERPSCATQGAGVRCGLSLSQQIITIPVSQPPRRGVTPALSTVCLSRVPRIQVCRPNNRSDGTGPPDIREVETCGLDMARRLHAWD